jgi:hypothetical protein
MTRHLFTLFSLFLFFASQSVAQNVQVTEEPAITDLMDAFISQNKEREHLEGFRIQILATTDRQRVESVKQGFRYRYPNIPIDWVHAKPHYKLRAGAFVTKLEALRLLYILKEDYPSAYLAKDRFINPEELIGGYY